MSVTKEFCAENMTYVPAAVEAGATRVELCDNLAVGGTTPSYGVLRTAAAYNRINDVPMMVMCRPRGGDFTYTDIEADSIADDIRCVRCVGCAGVVFGCLTLKPDGSHEIEHELVRRLVDEAKGQGMGISRGTDPVQVTFHMAFDELAPDDQLSALDELAMIGVDRVLTHGGSSSTRIEDNIDHLRRLVSHAGSKIAILPGGGVTWENVDAITSALGVSEAHGTRVVALP